MNNPNRLNLVYFLEKCDEELIRLQAESPNQPSLQRDLENFRVFIPRIDELVHKSGYNVYDFMIDRQVFTLQLKDELFSEFEFDLFNEVTVSEVVPMAIINSSKGEKVTNTGKRVSLQQKFKIYHDEYEFSNLPSIIKQWTKEPDNLRPDTFVLKISTEDKTEINSSKVKHFDYATFIYEIGKGFYLSMKHSANIKTELANVLKNLEESIPFKFEQMGSGAYSGKFGLDYFVLDKSLFRMILSKNPTSNGQYFTFRNCMWISESYRGLSYQSQTKIEFQLGSISQKFQITTKETTLNTRYEQYGIPFTFVPGVLHNYVSINSANNYDDILLMKCIFHCALYLYSQSFFPWTDPQTRQLDAVSYSKWHSYRLSVSSGNQLPYVSFDVSKESYRSFKIGMEYMNENLKQNKLKILKIADPTFYDRGISSEISGVEHQPMLLVRTTDPHWDLVIRNFVESKDFEKFQLIRYPFVVEGEYNPIKAFMPPYFIRSTKIKDVKRTYLDLKPAKDPKGSRDTYHPYVISTSTRNHYGTERGEDRQQSYNNLVDLSRPFVLKDLRSISTRDSQSRSTFTALKPGSQAELLGKLKEYLVRNLNLKDDVVMNRMGVEPGHMALVEACVAFDLPKAIRIREVARVNHYRLTDFIKGPVKEFIAKDSWVSASQELYDLPLERAKELFLKGDQEVTYEQYKTVLENYFSVSIMVITHYNRKLYFEKPRSKFFHSPRPHNSFSDGIIIIRHKNDSGYSRYEPLLIDNVKISGFSLTTILAKVNRYHKLGFSTALIKDESSLSVRSWSATPPFPIDVKAHFHPNVYFEKQILDGAGKLRGFTLKNISLFFWTEPLHPLINVDIFEIGDGNLVPSAAHDYSLVIETLAKIIPEFDLRTNLKYKTKRGYPLIKDKEVIGIKDETKFWIEGVWLIVGYLKIYISVKPIEISLSSFQIDDGAYFEISESETEFKKFDYMERLANIVVQIWQSMYVCWSGDDPNYFVERYVEVDPSVEGQFYVKIDSISRRIPKPREYTEDAFVKNGYQGRPNFEKYLELLQKMYGPNMFTPDHRIIVDSEKSKSALFHQAKLIQKLKEAYFLEDGHGISRSFDPETGMNKNVWIWKYMVNGIRPESLRLETSFINEIPKLKILMAERTYFKEFYLYASDFQVKGGGQRIFMDRDELEDFYEYENYRSEFILHTDNKIFKEYSGKTPLYYKNKKGHLFAFQRVEAGRTNKALAVAEVWMKKKVNLGFYAEETKNVVSVRGVTLQGNPQLNTMGIDDIDNPDDAYIFIYSKESLPSKSNNKDQFAVLLKINSQSDFLIKRDALCEI